MERPVALLVPVHNDPGGILHSLRHLPGEVPLDVVVVDDGSDPPLHLPEIAPPHRVYLLRLSENRGIAEALNAGVEWILQRGYPYLARLDAGDLALPGRFLRQLAFLETRPQHALVGGQVEFVDESGRLLYRERYPEDYADLHRRMHLKNCFIHPAVMLRTAVLRELGPYRTDFPAAEDYELFFRVVRKYPAANLPETVVRVRVSPKGISARHRRRQLLTRLAVQLRYFDPGLWESYAGVLATLGLLVLPAGLIRAFKRRVGGG